MTAKCKLFFIVAIMLALGYSNALAGGVVFGLGFRGGVSRLEADTRNPLIGPLASAHLRVSPLPYVSIDGEAGFSQLKVDDATGFRDFTTTIFPLELSAVFHFLPFKKFNPYIFVGGGGVFWNGSVDVMTAPGVFTSVSDDGFDSFLKTGAGFEYRLSRSFALDVGATFRLSFTESFDGIFTGDEDDQVLAGHVGFTYYFASSRNDLDKDYVRDQLDLMPDIAEDADGYLDHDGIPEKNPGSFGENGLDFPVSSTGASPIVLHHLTHKAESGKNLPIKSQVFSEVDLRVVATLYRPIGTRNWNVVRMENRGDNVYSGEIPGYSVTNEGLEYCVVAVDETLRGIGYSGLPSKPIEVEVAPSGTPWRIIGGVAGAAAIGSATYLIIRKQK